MKHLEDRAISEGFKEITLDVSLPVSGGLRTSLAIACPRMCSLPLEKANALIIGRL